MTKNISPEILAAYNMMLETVEEYLKTSSYFTIELKHKFVDYEYKVKDTTKKVSWKNFFGNTYAVEE